MIGQHKIIFTGPVGAGKTTAIASISDIKPISTEQAATDEVKAKKELTTVAMDYGKMNLGNNEIIHLYGTPGQKRFHFMWKLLCEGGIGLIIIIDHSNPDPIADLHQFLDSFQHFIHQTAVAIGITRLVESSHQDLDPYLKKVKEFQISAPIFEVDAREHDDVMVLVQSLLYSLDPGLPQEDNIPRLDTEIIR
jgi:signal recognition particle receptor subunit beta